MRKYNLLAASLMALLLFAFQACKGPEGAPGPEGPQGPQGPQGPEGPTILPAVFDVDNADFIASGNYRVSVNMPSNLEIYPSDVVLVYLAWEVVNIGGNDAVVWRPLPQVVPSGSGFFQYNYDYTMYDVEIFMDGTIDLATLDDSWTQDQIFRIVVVPADFLNARLAPVDYNNYEEVVKAFGIDESKVTKIKAN